MGFARTQLFDEAGPGFRIGSLDTKEPECSNPAVALLHSGRLHGHLEDFADSFDYCFFLPPPPSLCLGQGSSPMLVIGGKYSLDFSSSTMMSFFFFPTELLQSQIYTRLAGL